MAEAEKTPADSVVFPTYASIYRPGQSVYDEMCSEPGVLRPHWQALVSSLEAMGLEELERRGVEVQRLLQDNGVTYNVYDDPRDAQRPWEVDPIPLLMAEAEWASIEEGLEQRSRLLNLLLTDLYGPRTVIRHGLLPPELVFTHPGFLRPCFHTLTAGQRWLITHAVDLGRTPDGRFWALGDRTQSPAGAGYALETRIIMARAMPKLYRDAPLRRLAGFLEAERATLAGLAHHNQEHPHVVLLTPGPLNANYFEHAYLANYLSLSLVEGEDLAVRDGRVWLKTLGGLRPVDVILRRVTDEYCDPLELRGDSLVGTPGLLQAVRSGGVAVANPLGGGIVENPGLLAFLPTLCRQLLGEDLRLPSVDTWWCGQAESHDYVESHLEELVIRSILPGSERYVGATLNETARTGLLERIRAAPHMYVGQASLSLSTAPCLEQGSLVPRPVLLRGYSVAVEDGYRVMPGALVRVSPGLDDLRVSLRKGGISKDLWVLAPTPQKHISLLRQAYGPIVATRDGADLPSRVADNLYWLGRYCERLDSSMRLVREALGQFLELQEQDNANTCLDMLLDALGVSEHASVGSRRSRFFAIRRQLLIMLTAPEWAGSLPHTLAGMLRTGRAVRDHLGEDSWRILNRLQQAILRIAPTFKARETRESLGDCLVLSAAFAGLNNETIPHHYGWRFLDIGRYLERVLTTLDLFKLAFVNTKNSGVPLWEVVLSTTDNLTAYRRRYRSALHPTAIVDLLLFDEGNPRSVGYQLRRLKDQIARLPHKQDTPYRSAEERLILEAVSILQLADIELLSALEHSRRSNEELMRLLDELYRPLNTLSDAMTHSHFSHAEVPRQLITMMQ
ncbi:MAG: circularly permuted type 2 ATP-grasp protein [Gammaproteobacteria bacterium]|nr:circularly permuted type 2 ATP-grasp protein [Gammaproteobacteria bacterium]MCP5459503.1 circularly permuted type 2 ATP-grasp protein [Gammaproteobacteria bacterium]